jgi:hypothetical protein
MFVASVGCYRHAYYWLRLTSGPHSDSSQQPLLGLVSKSRLFAFGSPIKDIRNLNARYKYRSWESLKSIKAAITDWKPAFLVCNDDAAVRELHRIHSQARIETSRPESASLIELIESSLGDSRSFAVSRSKSRLMSVAKALHIPFPNTIVVNSHEDIDRQLGRVLASG